MARTSPLTKQLPVIPGDSPDGAMSAARAYLAAASAATRAEIAFEGRHDPAEKDLKILGLEHTPAYSAVVRH